MDCHYHPHPARRNTQRLHEPMLLTHPYSKSHIPATIKLFYHDKESGLFKVKFEPLDVQHQLPRGKGQAVQATLYRLIMTNLISTADCLIGRYLLVSNRDGATLNVTSQIMCSQRIGHRF